VHESGQGLDRRVLAAVNSRALGVGTAFSREQPVSPQRLSATDKVRRWQELWFADVRVEGLTDGGGDR